MDPNELSNVVIGACIEVHKAIGPGLLESIYEECLCRELFLRDMPFRRQVEVPVEYKGVKMDCGHRMDVVVAECVVLEVKAVEKLLPIHEAQLLTYLRLSRITLGLLVNFHVPALKDGIKRMVNNFRDPN